MSEASDLHRRDFTRHCLTGLGVASLGSVPAVLADDRKDEPPPKPTTELLLLSALMQQYPSEHYSEEIAAGIYRDIAGDLARGKALRAYPLQNSDEPVGAFRAYRAPPTQGAP